MPVDEQQSPPAPTGYAPWKDANAPAPAQEAAAVQPQYAPPSEGWASPAQAAAATLVPSEQGPGLLPWLFVALGFFIPLSALATGVWATLRTRDHGGYFPIALGAFAVLLGPIAITLIAAG